MLAVLFWFAMMHQAADLQSKTYNPTLVDERHIDICDSYLYKIDQVTGSLAFRRLYFVSEALKAAETGASKAQKALVTQRTAKNYTEMWRASLDGEQAWGDHMLCAAQIMGRYAPTDRTDDSESVIASLLVIAFNQEAHARAMLAVSQKRRFNREAAPTPAEELSDAEDLHGIEVEQEDAADSITKVSLLVAAESADMTDTKGGVIQRLDVSCAEESRIDRLLKPTSVGVKTVFSRSAAEMLKVLHRLPCKGS